MNSSSEHKVLSGNRALIFIFLCSAVYFTSYITRINYGAAILEIVNDTGITNSQAGAVSTAAFFTYGIGQLISGVIGDRIQPRKLIISGLLMTSLCNLVMPLLSTPPLMIALWGINGLCQALFWPPLVKLMAYSLNQKDYSRACISVGIGSNMATILIYLLAPLCIEASGWQMLFYVSSGCGILMAVIWAIFAPRNMTAQDSKVDVKANTAFKINPMIVSLLIPIGLAIILQGTLRDGLTTWMPTFISNTFHLSSSVSILTGIALPLFSVMSYYAATFFNNKLHSEVKSAAFMFGIGTVAAGVLVFTSGFNTIITVLLMAVITGCMHGVNLMIISRLPAYFAKYGKVSTVSGFLNALTYVGSGISTFGIALLSESFGWTLTIVIWFITALIGASLCSLSIRRFNKFIMGDKL